VLCCEYEFLKMMTTDNSGAYPNEWLVGAAKTGEILSLQLGTAAWDVSRTYNGFFGSSNYAWGEKIRVQVENLSRFAERTPNLWTLFGKES